MTLYVLDTDSVSFQQAGRENIIRRIEGVPVESVHTTVITFYEQMRGRLAIVSRAKEGPELIRAYERLHATLCYFSLVNLLPFTSDALQHLERLRAEKVRVGTQDLRIASIVLSVNGILVTSNRRDFDRIPGLVIEDWNTYS